MEEEKIFAYEVVAGNREGKRPLEIPSRRCVDNIKI
jgi:hypothetical protein